MPVTLCSVILCTTVVVQKYNPINPISRVGSKGFLT
jgi:hypothetical protein